MDLVVSQVPPMTAVSSVRLDWILKKVLDVPNRSEKGRHALKVMFVAKEEKKLLQAGVEKLEDRLESNGCGNGVGTGQGGLGIAGATEEIPAPSCWGVVVPGADVVAVGTGRSWSAGSADASRLGM
jgi:hypothetical protein